VSNVRGQGVVRQATVTMTSAPTRHRRFVHFATGLTEENSYIRIDGQASGSSSTTRAGRSTPNIHYHSVYRDKTKEYGSSKRS